MKECARCGRRLKPEARLYSSWTRNYYCVDIDKCSTRSGTVRRHLTVVTTRPVPDPDLPDAA